MGTWRVCAEIFLYFSSELGDNEPVYADKVAKRAGYLHNVMHNTQTHEQERIMKKVNSEKYKHTKCSFLLHILHLALA